MAVTSTRLLAEHEAQRVGVVHGDVHDHARAGRRRRDSPALQMRRQIDGVEDAGERAACRCGPPAIASRMARCVPALRR